MSEPNYYARNIRSRSSSDMRTKWALLVSCSANHATCGFFFLVRSSSFNRFGFCTFETCLWGRLRKCHSRLMPASQSSSLLEFRTWLFSSCACCLWGFLLTVVTPRGAPNKSSRFRVVLLKKCSVASVSTLSGIWASEHLRRTTPRCYQFPSRNLSRFWDQCTQWV